MTDKKKKLARHKRVATGLFILMTLLLALMLYLQKIGINTPWIQAIKAFAEAAMVGALADWFAVVALFKHPLNLPIPHTNLIERHQKELGQNLGTFVVDNFFTPRQIRPYVTQIKLTQIAKHFLQDPKNKTLIVASLQQKMLEYVKNAPSTTFLPLIEKEMERMVEKVDAQALLGIGVQQLIEEGKHLKVLDFLLDKSSVYLLESKSAIGNKVAEKFANIPLIGGLAASFAPTIGNEIAQEGAKYILEIKSNPSHPIRKNADQEAKQWAAEFSTSQKWKEYTEDLKRKLIGKDFLSRTAEEIFTNLQERIIADLQQENSLILQQISALLEKIVVEMEQHPRLDAWGQKKMYHFVMRHKKEVSTLIHNTVSGWESKDLSQKLELEVGKDLQYIRINGTLVGGSVGLLIYLLSQLLF